MEDINNKNKKKHIFIGSGLFVFCFDLFFIMKPFLANIYIDI